MNDKTVLHLDTDISMTYYFCDAITNHPHRFDLLIAMARQNASDNYRAILSFVERIFRQVRVAFDPEPTDMQIKLFHMQMVKLAQAAEPADDVERFARWAMCLVFRGAHKNIDVCHAFAPTGS
jgi:hypothetical protein